MSCQVKGCGKPESALVHLLGHSYKSPPIKASKPQPTRKPTRAPAAGCKLCGRAKGDHSFFGHAYQKPARKGARA